MTCCTALCTARYRIVYHRRIVPAVQASGRRPPCSRTMSPHFLSRCRGYASAAAWPPSREPAAAPVLGAADAARLCCVSPSSRSAWSWQTQRPGRRACEARRGRISDCALAPPRRDRSRARPPQDFRACAWRPSRSRRWRPHRHFTRDFTRSSSCVTRATATPPGSAPPSALTLTVCLEVAHGDEGRRYVPAAGGRRRGGFRRDQRRREIRGRGDSKFNF